MPHQSNTLANLLTAVTLVISCALASDVRAADSPATRPCCEPGTPGLADAPDPSRAADAAREAAAAQSAGQRETAIARWREAAASAHAASDRALESQALCRLGILLADQGHYDDAVATLNRSASAAPDPRSAIPAHLALANVATLKRHLSAREPGPSMFDAGPGAQEHLAQAAELAEKLNDPAVLSAVACARGNLLAVRKKFDEAVAAYDQSAQLAATAGDIPAQVRALLNAAYARVASADSSYRSATRFGNSPDSDDARAVKPALDDAVVRLTKATALATSLSPSGLKAELLLSAAATAQAAIDESPATAPALVGPARAALVEALKLAEARNDTRALSAATGALGALYERHGGDARLDDALSLTRRAAFAAQQLRSADLLFRWHWQAGRILRRMGRPDESIASLQLATWALKPIRNDLALGTGNKLIGASLRESAGPLYYELADLLLRRAAALDGEPRQAALREARRTIETLRSAQLEEYLQDSCASQLDKQREDVDQILGQLDPSTAVIYFIPLPDRTEILVSIRGNIQRVVAPVSSAQLDPVLHAFRDNLMIPATADYRQQARQLYTWLIDPIEREAGLADKGIHTLVFVPDGAMRTIPFAALLKDKEFLVQRYAVAVSPGLSLMAPKSATRARIELLASGLSVERTVDDQVYPGLQNVSHEIDALRGLFAADAQSLMDDQFVRRNLNRQMRDNSFSVVHIASHGKFGGTARDTFVLTYAEKLGMDDLERLIEPSGFRGKPIELLSLSACQTAAGDDLAALGLAGAAIKAGAKSAFGTLWSVNDDATSRLVSNFYTRLRDNPNISKAQALQAAQCDLLKEQTSRHPYYWGPYLIVGNWL